MGLFDTIICHYPLPGTVPDFIDKDHCFQSKSLDCLMDTYLILDNKTLQKRRHPIDYENPGDFVNECFTGIIEFYTSNICASGPGVYTNNGDDAEEVEYSATFVHGKLTDIVQIEYDRKPALKHEPHKFFKPESPEDRATHLEQHDKIRTGTRLFIHWGGRPIEKGYYADVVYDGAKQWCVVCDGKLELIDRWAIGRTAFNTREECEEYEQQRTRDWQARRDEYDKLCAERSKSKV